MHGKKSFLALSTAFAALFVGCEWTGTSESDSWSSAYDAMNFSGTYRAVTSATSLEETATEDDEIATLEERVGSFTANGNTASGKTSKANIVPGSFQATAGGYIWNDNDSSGLLTFVSSDSEGAGNTTQAVNDKHVGDYDFNVGGSQTFSLGAKDILEGSVVVKVSGQALTSSSGSMVLNGGDSWQGTVTYSSGVITISWVGGRKEGKSEVKVSYSIRSTGTETYSGYGRINYSSGAWSLQMSPTMPSTVPITIRYSYYLKDSSTSVSYTTIYSTDSVTALTVAQNGQNLSITLNNGIVMSGKFTNVQQTGKVNQDTNAGYNTYNAQFQVQTKDSKMVGSLNYDLKTGYRMLNGSWTWGKNTYDVQAVGPAWLNSADASTLSAGVQQSQK